MEKRIATSASPPRNDKEETLRQDGEERYINHSWTQVDVQCPFWKGETRRAVVCEGLLAGERIRRFMPDEKAKTALMKELCCKNYRQCQIFQLVYGGYMK